MPGSWSQRMYTCHVVEQPYRHYSFWCALLAHKLFNTNERSSECCEIVLEFAFDRSGSISYLLFLCLTNPPYSYSFYAVQTSDFSITTHNLFYRPGSGRGHSWEERNAQNCIIFQYILGQFNLLKKQQQSFEFLSKLVFQNLMFALPSDEEKMASVWTVFEKLGKFANIKVPFFRPWKFVKKKAVWRKVLESMGIAL